MCKSGHFAANNILWTDNFAFSGKLLTKNAVAFDCSRCLFTRSMIGLVPKPCFSQGIADPEATDHPLQRRLRTSPEILPTALPPSGRQPPDSGLTEQILDILEADFRGGDGTLVEEVSKDVGFSALHGEDLFFH